MQTSIEGFQISPQQLRLCSIRQERDVYRAYCSIELTGSVDSASLEQAINRVVAQNAIFRTAFHRLPGVKIPVQVINDAGEIAWQCYDLREFTPQEQERQLEDLSRRLQEQETREGSPYEDGPFLACAFITFSADKHILLTGMHALHADNATLCLFARKIAQAYSTPLAILQSEDDIQYVQVSEWQNELMAEEDADDAKLWWREKNLSGSVVGSLPNERKLEHGREQETRYHGRESEFTPAAFERSVDGATQAKLEKLAAQYAVTPSTCLLACWHILLWRLTGQETIPVSVAVDGRIDEELSQVAGPFTKYLPIISHFYENQTVVEALSQVKEALDEAIQWQLYFSYPEATDSDPTAASFSYVPFSFEYSAWPADCAAGALTFSLQTWHTYLEPFKVKVFARQNKQALTLEFQYDTALFDGDEIQRLAGQYDTLLTSAVNQPMTPISALDILGENERTLLLTTFNDTATSYPADQCLHQLFEAQARKTPGAIALRCGERTLTYAELDQQANQVARYVQSLGIKPEELAGVYMEHSLEMVIGMLGILKAGGAYVPLDPVYPPARLAFMIADARVSIVLTQQHLVKDIPQTTLAIALDQDWGVIAQHADSKPVDSITNTSLAYVIYTSGSTGTPKGVMISHRGMVNYLYWCCQYYEVASGNGSVVHSSPAFDLTITSLFAPLLVGRTVHLISDQQGVEGLAKALLQRSNYSLVKLTPAHLDILNHAFLSSDIASVARVLVLGGEALSGESLNLWRTHAPETRLVNEYGPTETVVGCCIYEVPSTGPVSGSVPIGRPIANTQLYLLDTRLQPVPPGVPGELYIGGHGVARGYLRRPDLTAERFLPNAFAAEPGARVYKTGDLAHHLPDGNLEFLGRADHQVKIRGYRIELGEIEAMLSQHPAVAECAVLAREDVPSDKRLVAYVVLQVGERLPGADQRPFIAPNGGGYDEWRLYLQQRLPEYMLPSAFVILKRLPLTPNGKVDREALPAPDTAITQQDREITPPRNPIEEVLVAIWQQLLRVNRVGIFDDFFALGGHSLLATQLASRILSVFQVEVPLLDVFETPTIAGIAGQIEMLLSSEQKAVIPPLIPASRQQNIPVSFAQQRLWFLDQLEPGTSAYNMPAAVRLRGPLALLALQQSVQELVRRHESLRTTFSLHADQPIQVIHPPAPFCLPLVDLTTCDASRREEEVQRLIQQETDRPFDLAHGPLLRTMLLRLEQDEHILLHTMHHIISDGWSSGVLAREAAALYNAFVQGKPSPLPALPIQYADYSLWQRQWLQGEALDAQTHYWTQQLASLAPLALPIDHPRPSEQTFYGLRQSFHLSASLTGALKQLSQREEVTFFMTLLAAFQVLLARYTGQSHIPVGTPIANRTRTEVEGLIGFFINTLVMCTDLSGNPTFLEVVARVRAVCYGAYAHQDMPFEKLVEILQPERDLSRSPLFQVMFILENTPRADNQAWAGITWQGLTAERNSAKFELTLFVAETAEGLYGTLEYNTDLFEPDTIARLLKHFHVLLEGIVLHPERRLAALPLTDEAELQQMLVDWNPARAAYPLDVCLHQLFEEQVARAPHAIAILDEQLHLSYQQLNSQANRLARALRRLGVDQERCVGIYLERSCSLVIAMVAVLKAGGAYLPLDPGTPIERVRFMLADARAVLLLTQTALAELIVDTSLPILLLDQDEKQWQQEEDANLRLSLFSQQAAYIIYTSGSTGRPKGVVGHHRGMVNRLHWAWQYYPFAAGESCCQKTSMSFVDAIAELFAPLLAGVPTLLLAGEQSSDPYQLVTALARWGISRLVLVPGLLRSLLQTYPDITTRLPHLDCWVCSGEALPPELVKRFQQVLPGRRLLNLYGSSEVAADATAYEVTTAPETASSIPIGRPLANTRVYLLDQCGQPAPIGVVGEVSIGGEGLARGYFGQTDLTAEKFVPDSWCGMPGERMYRTGDQARWLADGTLEYLGRSDHQVKIRGFRIELGEIETVLAQHPLVDVAVVTSSQESSGTRLTAYIVPSSSESEQLRAEFLRTPVKHLRSYLQQKLPEYMLPSFFIILDALPLTPSGKVDRRALPSPDGSVVQRDQQYVAARTPLEEVLSAFWLDILGLQQVGIYDNFFELGGHSLLATQVISRIRAMLHVDFPLRNLFETPTIAGLAEQIEPVLRGEQASEAFPLVAVAREAPLPLSFAQQRLWFLYQWEPTSTYYNIIGAVRLAGNLNHAALEESFATIVQRHEVLRTTFETLNTQPIQVITPVLKLALPIVDLSTLSTSRKEMLIQQLTEQEGQYPFNLAQGPLLRLVLLRIDSQDHVLLLTIHHIVFDGWSLSILIRELAVLYQAYSQGLPSPLSPLPFQYADYALWQRQWLHGEALQAQVDYWRKQLADAPTLLQLPLDHPRPAFQGFRGDRYDFALDAELTCELKSLCQREGVTLFMALLAAFQVLLARYSGQQDIMIGTGIANRTRAEIEGLIGFFVNTLVLRADLSEEPTFLTLLNQIRKTTLGAYAHQDLPFEYLVEVLKPERSLSYAPLFQVTFVLQNTPMTPLELPGITLLPVETTTHTAKNDLTLYMSEGIERLYATLEYNTGVFERDTISSMAVQLQTLLAEIVADPTRSATALPLLSQHEQQQLLQAWNAAQAPNFQEVSLPELFEAQVVRSPEAIALVFEDQQLTYQALNRRADQLARYLHTRGVGPETKVGLCLERSLETVISLFAILKAGAAYVPLDPAYPPERLRYLIEDSRLALLLTQPEVRPRLPNNLVPLISLESLWQDRDVLAVTPVDHRPLSGQLAYLIYTSGSTGQPKGCMITHQALAQRVQALMALFDLHPGHRQAQLVSLSFDVFGEEVFPALCSGATVVVLPSPREYAITDMMQLCDRLAITKIELPTSYWRQTAEELAREGRQAPSSLSLLVTGGESPSVETLQQWANLIQQPMRVFNLYGPTETTILATSYAIEISGAQAEIWQEKIPLGRPLADTQAYVLDQHGQTVPVGVPGELYLGGSGLARGYCGRAELTAERFVPHPFSQQPGARLYRSGDLVRYRRDGNLEFVGRVDQQIKLRGYRIELGEIEACLRTSPTVQDAAVLLREDVPGERQLVAYVVARSLSQTPVDHLQRKQVEQVRHWQDLYEEIYAQTAASADPLFNIIGWNSSYTGLPLPVEHMREWVEHTVTQLQALHPQHVLEIGCGTGLLLLRLAPHCQRYVGTDFSPAVLAVLQRQVERQGLRQVQLQEQYADQLEQWPSGSFDLVVLNSVIQYFPSLDYLQRVLDQALRLLRPGGTLFVGDVRNLSLLDTFHTSVELAQAPASQSVGDVRQRIAQRRVSEEELLVAPTFFHTLSVTYPQIRQVQTRPKRGHYHNELTCYRYDVVLQVDDKMLQELKPTWIDWNKEGMTITSFRHWLIEQQPELVGLRHVPNARLQRDLLARHMTQQVESSMSVRNLRTLLQAQQAEDGVDPEQFWQMAQELSYIPELNWANGRYDGSYEVLLRRPGLPGQVDFPPGEAEPKQAFANTPLAGMQRHKWLPELRSYLKDFLPEYMAPTVFIPLEHLPLAPNGKLDRRALPAPRHEHLEEPESHEAPTTLVEELLAGLWASVLGRERVGRHANFFDLGGHSLLATQLVSRIRTTFQIELPLRQLFAAPTVAALAEHLEKSQQTVPIPSLLPVSRATSLPLSFAQQRLWFIDQLNPGNTAYLMPNVWKLSGALHTMALEASLKALIRRHESLRTTFCVSREANAHVQAGQPVLVIHTAIALRVPVIDLRGLPEHERERAAERLVVHETQRPFDLRQGPLFRVYLLRLDTQEHVLLLTLHHIISDGWSMLVLARELTYLYRTLAGGQAAVLPPLPIQYADYAVWQRQWLQGEVLEAQLGYWWRRLAGAPALKLPLDHPRPAMQSFRGAQHSFVLTNKLSQQLIALSRRENATLFMTLLAAFKVLLYRTTGQHDIVIGTDSANRNHSEVEGIIGFFINLLVLRTDVSGKPSFREVLHRVRETVLGAHMRQETPFELLVERLAPAHTLDRIPLIQTLFVWQNLPPLHEQGDIGIQAGAEEKSLVVSAFSPANEVSTAKFDLAVFLREQAGELYGTVAYNADVFEARTITTMMARFERLLRSAAQQPDLPVDLLNFFAVDEKQRQKEQRKQSSSAQARLRASEWFHVPERETL